MNARTFKTSVRLVGEQDVDEFQALCALLRKRPHELAGEMVRVSLAATRDDPEIYDRVQRLVASARAYQHRDEETGVPLAHVVPIDRGRRRSR